MKNLTTTTKTIVFASVIATMIISFSGMQFAVAEEQIEIPKNLDDKKYFIQDQAMEALQNMTEAERAMYFAHMGEYLKNRTPGQIQLDIEIEKLSYIVLQDKALMGEKYDPMNPSKQAQEQFAVIQDHPMVKGAVELEKFIEKVEFEKAQALKTGVKYEERAYSAEELGINLKEDTTSFQSSSLGTKALTISDNVILGNHVRISYPALNWQQLPINLLVSVVDNNVNDYPHYVLVDAVSPRVNNVGGTFHFSNYGCLVDNGNMNNNVQFDLLSTRLITNSFGTTIYTDVETKNDKKLYFNQEGYCVFSTDTVVYSNPISVLNYHAYHTSGILDVQVT